MKVTMKIAKACKYYKKGEFCEYIKEHEEMQEGNMVGSFLGPFCPKDSGTDGKGNKICFQCGK